MHGFKGIGNSDILKTHGLNKDPVPYQSINQQIMPEYIYDWSDGSRTIVDFNGNLMWTSIDDKVTTIPTQYFNNTAQSRRPFRFYEKNGKKYVISYISGGLSYYFNGGNTIAGWVYDSTSYVFHICEINSNDIRLVKTRTVKNVNDAVAEIKQNYYIGKWAISGVTPVIVFEYDVQQNKVIAICSKRGNASAYFSDDIKNTTQSHQVLIDLNGTPIVRQMMKYSHGSYDNSIGYASCNIDNMLYFASLGKNSNSFSKNEILQNNTIKSTGITFSANQKTRHDTDWGMPGTNGLNPQGCFYYDKASKHLSFSENIQGYNPYNGNTASSFETNIVADWGGRSSILFFPHDEDILKNSTGQLTYDSSEYSQNLTVDNKRRVSQIKFTDLYMNYNQNTAKNDDVNVRLNGLHILQFAPLTGWLLLLNGSGTVIRRVSYMSPTYKYDITLKQNEDNTLSSTIVVKNKNTGQTVVTYTDTSLAFPSKISEINIKYAYNSTTADYNGTFDYKYDVYYQDSDKFYTNLYFPEGKAASSTATVQNLPTTYNMQYKWGNDLWSGTVKSILLYKSIKADNPNTIFVHAKNSVFDYETNIEIQTSGFTTFNWNNIIFKDEQGNILPHFIEPVQPSNSRVFVIKQNLKKGWNTFTFEQGSSNTSNGYNVFEEFFDFNDGKPQKWTVPNVYEFNPTLGLIKGVNGTNNTNTQWIELNELPQIGKRYELGIRAHSFTDSGYFQFGQFNSLFIRQSTLTQNLDGVRCRPTWNNGKSSTDYSYFSGTVNMRNNTQVWGSTSRSNYQYRNFGADVVGFEYGSTRCLVYQYDHLQTRFTGFEGNVSKMFSIVPNSNDGYGIKRVPQNTNMTQHGLKLYRMWNNTATNDGMYYYRRRKAYQGESVTIGFKNTYIVQTTNKTFIGIPF